MFSAAALDRAEDFRGDPLWLRRCWQLGRALVLDAQGDALADADGALLTLPAAALDEACEPGAILLGVDALPEPSLAWFAVGGGAAAIPAGLLAAGQGPHWVGLRRAGLSWPAQHSSLFAHARALSLWHARGRHCGSCGAATRVARAGHSLQCSNSGCGWEQFPRLDPAIIVLVTDGDRCLLGRQAGWPAGQYSTLAGFVEPGESLEDALRREVAEESGVRVGTCCYRGSQPWPFPSSLMIGFRAVAEDPSIRLGNELEDARWFGVDELLAGIAAGRLRASSPVSIAFQLLHEWVVELRGAAAAEGLQPRR